MLEIKEQRPTLEEQIAVSKMTEEELIQALMPHTFLERMEFWIFCHHKLLWHIICWNWFDILEGTEDADKYRSWYIKLKRKLFGDNKEQGE